MIALSVRQPWAWLIVRPDLTDAVRRAAAFESGEIKDIENRCWPTRLRGRILVHAAKGMTRDEYEDGTDPLFAFGGPVIELPARHELQRGGIVGSVEIVDCVTASDSLWFRGTFGFVLRDAKPLPFRPYRGQLGFFDVPEVAA